MFILPSYLISSFVGYRIIGQTFSFKIYSCFWCLKKSKAMNINSMHALCFTLWKLVGSSHASQDLKFHMMGFGVNLCGLSQSGYSGPSVLRIFLNHFIDDFLASFFSGTPIKYQHWTTWTSPQILLSLLFYFSSFCGFDYSLRDFLKFNFFFF